tara:strand:- start:21 stop:749 length:729 start_codon:yes stop_codon:yes gene_type:complete
MAFKMKNSGGAFKMMGSSPMKETHDVAYGGTKTWEQGQKDSGGTLNDLTAKRATLEKGSNEWKENQNKINKALGSSKVYDTTKDIATKTNDEGEKIMRGVGSNKGKTLSAEDKSAEKAAVGTQRDIVTKARGAEGGTDKNARDEAQREIGLIKSGRDNADTGTAISRTLAKGKVAVNDAQMGLRSHRDAVKAWKEGGKEGERPKLRKENSSTPNKHKGDYLHRKTHHGAKRKDPINMSNKNS